LGTTQLSASEFQGTAWGAYAGSLGGVSLSDIPVNQGLHKGNGLLFNRAGGLGYINYYRGTLPVTASIRLSPSNQDGSMPGGNTSGLTFGSTTNPGVELQASIVDEGDYSPMEDIGGSTKYGLTLTESLAGQGFIFDDVPNNGKSEMRLLVSQGIEVVVDLGDNSSIGTRIKPNLFNPDRFTFSSYSASLNLTSVNEITKTNYRSLDVNAFGSNKIVLNPGIPGYGLKYRDTYLGRNVLQIQDGASIFDDLEVVSCSLFTQLKTTGLANSPLRFGRSFLDTNQNSVDIFYTGS